MKRVMCKWSNEKALLMNMGTPDFYTTFKLFTVQEFEQYLYVFFWNGLNPSPQIEWKLRPEETDPIHHSAFVRKVLGPNPTLRLYHWKCCFACQYTKLAISSQKSQPNHTIDEHFFHLQIIFRYCWMPAHDFSIDEATMGFKGHHQDKLRIPYKKEGDV